MLNTAISAAASFMLVALPLDQKTPDLGKKESSVKEHWEYLKNLDGRIMIDTSSPCFGKDVMDYQIDLAYPYFPVVIVTGVGRKTDEPYLGNCMIKTMVFLRHEFDSDRDKIVGLIGPQLTKKIEDDLRGVEGFQYRPRTNHKLSK